MPVESIAAGKFARCASLRHLIRLAEPFGPGLVAAWVHLRIIRGARITNKGVIGEL